MFPDEPLLIQGVDASHPGEFETEPENLGGLLVFACIEELQDCPAHFLNGCQQSRESVPEHVESVGRSAEVLNDRDAQTGDQSDHDSQRAHDRTQNEGDTGEQSCEGRQSGSGDDETDAQHRDALDQSAVFSYPLNDHRDDWNNAAHEIRDRWSESRPNLHGDRPKSVFEFVPHIIERRRRRRLFSGQRETERVGFAHEITDSLCSAVHQRQHVRTGFAQQVHRSSGLFSGI